MISRDRSEQGTEAVRRVALSEKVAAGGLWDHMSPEDQVKASAQVAAGEYPFNVDGVHEEIQFFADGEDLSEGGVQDLLAEITPALERYGVTLIVEVIADPFAIEGGGGDYVLSLNGTRCVIWTEAEAENNLWLEATARPLNLVNTLLAGAGTEVRAHLLHEGSNDGTLLLLNPAVPEAMRASGLFQESDIPTLPTLRGSQIRCGVDLRVLMASAGDRVLVLEAAGDGSAGGLDSWLDRLGLAGRVA